MTHSKTCPVIWALGRKGYLTQYPLMVAYNRNNIQPMVAVTSHTNLHLNELIGKKQILQIIEVPTNFLNGIKFIFSLARVRKHLIANLAANASLVHIIMMSPWDIFFVSCIKKAKVPLILTIHDATRHAGEKSWLLDKITYWLIGHADCITALSQFVVNELIHDDSIKKPIKLVEDGWLTRSEEPLKPRAYPANKPLKLLFHGRIHAYKGLDILLDALLFLQNEGVNYSLTIAGDGDLTPYRNKLSTLSNININNSFLSDNALLLILRNHNIAILPYTEASQSGVAVDVQWAALPAIVTPVGALKTQFKNGIDAIVLEKVDSKMLADAIKKLYSDAAFYESISIGAFQAFQPRAALMKEKWQLIYASIDSQY